MFNSYLYLYNFSISVLLVVVVKRLSKYIKFFGGRWKKINWWFHHMTFSYNVPFFKIILSNLKMYVYLLKTHID